MASVFTQRGDQLEWRLGHERVVVTPWGADSARVQAGMGRVVTGLPDALLDPRTGDPESSSIRIADDHAELYVGALVVRVSAAGQLDFRRSVGGEIFLTEKDPHVWWPKSRNFGRGSDGHYRIEQYFAACDDEKFFGLGQQMHGRFDQKGVVMELAQRNGEVSIPFLVSSRGYGFLWNSPAVGRVELAVNGTRWISNSARQIDYWVTTGSSPAEILDHYAGATGRTPSLPAWASGFWQSKLRYSSQDELLGVAREYHRRGIPLSVIVADYFHWKHVGDWKFVADLWPDPRAMVEELRAMNTELMVSVWPTVSPLSDSYAEMRARGMLIDNYAGVPFHSEWPDAGVDASIAVAYYDATNAEARTFFWNQLSRNYGVYGIKAFWLDACEPELLPGDMHNLELALGPGEEVGNLYPREHARGVNDGLVQSGIEDGIMLTRSAWAGSQALASVLWSGDIESSFSSLRASVASALNVSLSGIHWWTTDIGGFHGGDPADPDYRELLIRWFQFGAFCPIFRLHGWRSGGTELGGMALTGGLNEVWSFGDATLDTLLPILKRREALRPYIHEHLEAGRTTGLPLLRPLLLEFPADPRAWQVSDQFMFGPQILVAPVLELGVRARSAYLPDGARWQHVQSGETYDGGQSVAVDADLRTLPLFIRITTQGNDFGPPPDLSESAYGPYVC